ncbi:GIY-YIG nuclease family protein (plasmid) [Rossellomorea sp. FS2]|uniref:GIY-YIG nuclease family protein n=1 Tax=Rossellomorea sp. FS2 TaxID=3391447 RepID=UPI003A4DAACF
MHYLYRFINKEEQIIYIGRTNHLNARLMSQHFTAQGHLSPECYEECAKVEYAEVSN